MNGRCARRIFGAYTSRRFRVVCFLATLCTIVQYASLCLTLAGAQEYECPASHCPDAWITFRGSCYYVSDYMSVDWTEAAHHCREHDAHLVTIESKDEESFIVDQLQRLYRDPNHRPGEEFWIGANDEMIEGVWVWYTGDKPLSGTYTDWYPGQPGSDGTDEDCAVIAVRPVNNVYVYNGWHDAPCAARHHPICEISPHVPTISSIIG